jgi:hypothetical protein
MAFDAGLSGDSLSMNDDQNGNRIQANDALFDTGAETAAAHRDLDAIIRCNQRRIGDQHSRGWTALQHSHA